MVCNVISISASSNAAVTESGEPAHRGRRSLWPLFGEESEIKRKFKTTEDLILNKFRFLFRSSVGIFLSASIDSKERSHHGRIEQAQTVEAAVLPDGA